MQRVIRTQPAGLPLRLLLITLLLAGLALAAGQHCADDALLPAAHISTSAGVDPGPPDSHQGHPDHHPDDLIGVCLTVLAGIVGALWLLTTPRSWRALIERLHRLRATTLYPGGLTPALPQLCVSRT